MKFTVLGSGTSVPTVDRGPAGHLVRTATASVLVDGGSGTLQRCAKTGVDPTALTAGVYSHRHPDHCADLLPLLFAMKVGPPARSNAYSLYGGEGWQAYLTQLQELYGKWILLPNGLNLTEFPLDGPGCAQLASDLVLRTAPANHSASALHLRFESEGHAVVFSGDTGPSAALTELTRGADLLVCECAGSDEQPIPGHLWPTAIAEMVREAQPKTVWLVHMYPQVDPVQAVRTVESTGIPCRHASDGDTWDASEPRLPRR